MRYRCTHCDHVFDLEDREFKRCPKCFWTTSLAPAAEYQQPAVKKEVIPPAHTAAPKRPMNLSFIKPILLVIFFAALIGGLGYLAYQSKDQLQKLNFKLGESQKIAPAADSQAIGEPKKMSPEELQKTLSEEEQAQLSRKFEITVPRQLTSDEENILKKQVAPSAKSSENLQINRWKKEDFEKMLATEQKSRRIQLGWSYTRSLNKVFEKRYLSGLQALDKGNLAEARASFIEALSFPVFRNNPVRHRAVALVMLRPYINDVIGKIAILNQRLVVQTYMFEVNSIYEAYQAIFPVLELQEWNKAYPMIVQLRDRIKNFEAQPKNSVPYPPSFGRLDPEIQRAIQEESAPKPESAINLKSLNVDLDLKEKIVKSNTPEELTRIQKQYEQLLEKIELQEWQEAYEGLSSIEFPPELVEDVRNKLAVIEKILAVSGPQPETNKEETK